VKNRPSGRIELDDTGFGGLLKKPAISGFQWMDERSKNAKRIHIS
jgi:hypothetical protein